MTRLPVLEVRLEHVPITLLPATVDIGPVADGDGMPEDLQHGIPLLVLARVVQHLVQERDVIYKHRLQQRQAACHH